MVSAAPHNAYAELFERLDALTSRGFGAWCAQALGDEVAYAIDVDWYRAGAQVSEALAQTGTGAAAERVRDELESFLGDYFTVRRRSASPEQVLCGSMANDAEFRPRALTGSTAACLLFLEHGGCDPWSAADEPAGIEVSTPDTREPDPELLRRQIGMLCLQYAVLENESALLRSTCLKMGSYDQRGGIDPATLAFIDRGDWDAFQPIVRNRNFAKTQRRIGTLLDAPGYSEASDAELPLAEPQLNSIPSTPKPANRKAGADWVKYLAKRTFFTVIEGNVDILAGQAGAIPACRVELARTGWLWKFTQGRAEDASARRAPIAARTTRPPGNRPASCSPTGFGSVARQPRLVGPSTPSTTPHLPWPPLLPATKTASSSFACCGKRSAVTWARLVGCSTGSKRKAAVPIAVSSRASGKAIS